MRRLLLLGITSPLKSNWVYLGWGPLFLADWRGGGGPWPFEVEGCGEGGEAAGSGDLRNEVNNLGGREELGEAAGAGFLIGGGVLSSPPIAGEGEVLGPGGLGELGGFLGGGGVCVSPITRDDEGGEKQRGDVRGQIGRSAGGLSEEESA